MKKIVFLNLFILIVISGCANFKVVSKIVDEQHVSFKKPLIVIPYNGLTEGTSKRFEKKLQECYKNKNIDADFYLLEIKQEVLKLNEEKKSSFKELISICNINKDDGIILFKYDKYNYGAYGVSFSQEVFAINKDSEKVTWYARGFTTYDAMRKYCEEITDKMTSEKVLLSF